MVPLNMHFFGTVAVNSASAIATTAVVAAADATAATETFERKFGSLFSKRTQRASDYKGEKRDSRAHRSHDSCH